MYPGKGRGADHENSRASAIDLKCLSCCSGQRAEVAECRTYDCFLWPFRPYGGGERPTGAVPAVEQYDEWSAARTPDIDPEKMRENMAKAQEARRLKRAERVEQE